ncbi:hypothetical protein Tco_1271275, partial [Tanacetum coccineum]
DAKKKSDNAQDGDEHAGEDHTMNEQARIKQSENAQAKKSIHAPQMEQHVLPHPRSNQTLSFAEYGN